MDPKKKEETKKFVKEFYENKFPDKDLVMQNPRVLVGLELLKELYTLMGEKTLLPEGINFESFCHIIVHQYKAYEMLWELDQMFDF